MKGKADTTTTLQQIKDEIAAYRAERGWVTLDPRDIAISIVLEASELLEHFQWTNDIDVEANREAIMGEFADTLNYLLMLAMTLDFEAADAWHEKLKRIKTKYPTDVFNANKTFDRNAYQQIKQAYRQKGKSNDKA